jgi:hypothetical protein
VGRIAVVGDVGGHADELRRALASVGVDGTIPAGLVVVQVGELIGPGRSDSAVISFVDGYLKSQPGQWIQLASSHEAHYAGGEQTAGLLLRQWWESRAIHVAAALLTDDGDEYLISHAGLTVDAWRELGEPMTAAGAAMLLNDRPEVVWRHGEPPWVDAGRELHEPWMAFHARGGFVPFGQIHGHSSLFDYGTQTWWAPEKVRLRATVDTDARHVQVRVGGRLFFGVDPQHASGGAARWRPLVLEGQLV